MFIAIFSYMKFLRFALCAFLMATFCFAGEGTDKQMELFYGFLKKAKYNEAATAILEKVDLGVEEKATNISVYAGYLNRFTVQHGKPLNYTKWRHKSLSKSFDETVYQINCEKSAWMVMIREYASPDGKSFFSEFNIVTEEDIFERFAK